MFEKTNDLNARLENVSLNNVKRNALAIEKVSYVTPKPTVNTSGIILNLNNLSLEYMVFELIILKCFYVNNVIFY
ncbi:hypothetical protein BpHYR1_012681 [Brachionus plicatilis]|uniref:Uncharacterized protein n=1 Tax=Brachionus plicatilis TaxID=10195 RepID=A0A3M7RRA6_BRAPC|nr:hypothetical protein BpHYR1_012681 [Brachionus plicatilis]